MSRVGFLNGEGARGKDSENRSESPTPISLDPNELSYL
jgi:hypothetical protein